MAGVDKSFQRSVNECKGSPEFMAYIDQELYLFFVHGLFMFFHFPFQSVFFFLQDNIYRGGNNS